MPGNRDRYRAAPLIGRCLLMRSARLPVAITRSWCSPRRAGRRPRRARRRACRCRCRQSACQSRWRPRLPRARARFATRRRRHVREAETIAARRGARARITAKQTTGMDEQRELRAPPRRVPQSPEGRRLGYGDTTAAPRSGTGPYPLKARPSPELLHGLWCPSLHGQLRRSLNTIPMTGSRTPRTSAAPRRRGSSGGTAGTRRASSRPVWASSSHANSTCRRPMCTFPSGAADGCQSWPVSSRSAASRNRSR
jgi:hypothetical protein